MSLIIDVGHGGKDPGGGTNQYFKEKDYVLQLSLYMYKRCKELKIPVKITRMNDVYIAPDERARMVRESGMKHCISNHVNTGGGDGAEFIHSKFSKDTWPKLMAEEIMKEGQNVRRIFTRTMNNGLDYYFMNRDTGVVETVISEYGFADSKLDDVEQLRRDQLRYAEAQIKAYCNYANYKYLPPEPEKKPEKETSKETSSLFTVQVGAYKQRSNAEMVSLQLQKDGYPVYIKEVKR